MDDLTADEVLKADWLVILFSRAREYAASNLPDFETW